MKMRVVDSKGIAKLPGWYTTTARISGTPDELIYEVDGVLTECPHCGVKYPAEEFHMCRDTQEVEL